eukprot:g27969.t1
MEKAVKETKEDRIERKALKLLNEFLYKSLTTVEDVIVRAAVRNRCWILVDGGPNGGLLLLKHAAERMKEKPVILVMNSLKTKRFPYKDVSKFVGQHNKSDVKEKLHTLEELAGLDKNQVDKEVEKIIKLKTEKAWEDWEETLRKKAQEEEGSKRRQSQLSRQSKKSTGTEKAEEVEKWTRKDQKEVEEVKVKGALMTARLLKHAKPIDIPDMDPLKLLLGETRDIR